MKKNFIICSILLVLIGFTGICAWALSPDEKDYDESVRLPVRRLHPEREFDKAMKKMHQEHEAKAKAQEEKERAREEKERLKQEKKKNKHDNRVIPARPQQQQASSADKSLMRELLSKDYSLKKYDLYEEPKPITWKDDPINHDIASLMPFVTPMRSGGKNSYIPTGVSTANDANEVYFSFEASGNKATSPLRLCVNYYADDPLNYNDMVFMIDGFEYKFRAATPNRGKLGAHMYWERSSDALGSNDKDLVYALSHCHWARITLKGADGIDHVKMLSQGQLDAFTHSFELYRAMGGTF